MNFQKCRSTESLDIRRAEKEQKDILLEKNVTDVMKFVSCLMVGASHYSGYALANGVSSNIVYKVIAANGGYLGVAIFFFLSGYGLMKSDMMRHVETTAFFKRRLMKTYLPAVLVSAIWFGFAAMTSLNLLCNHYYFIGIIWNFNDEVMWFVNSILIMYVAFRLYLFFKSYLTKYQWLVLIMVGIFTYSFLRFFCIGSTLSVPLFFLGIGVAQYGYTIRRFIQNSWVEAMLIVIATVLLWMFRHDNYLLHGWINYVTIGTLLWIMSRWNITLSSLPKWIGPCSYDYYLVHHKVHLALVMFLGIDRLWTFAIGSALTTALFYKVRTLLRL